MDLPLSAADPPRQVDVEESQKDKTNIEVDMNFNMCTEFHSLLFFDCRLMKKTIAVVEWKTRSTTKAEWIDIYYSKNEKN